MSDPAPQPRKRPHARTAAERLEAHLAGRPAIVDGGELVSRTRARRFLAPHFKRVPAPVAAMLADLVGQLGLGVVAQAGLASGDPASRWACALLEHRIATQPGLAFRPGLDAGPWKSL